MTEYIIAISVGIIQIVLSINLILRKRNKAAILSEILSSLILLLILNEFSIGASNIFWRNIGLALIEYSCIKIFIALFMLIARYYSFYRIKAICHNKEKAKPQKLKFARTFNKVNYWPKLKLGLPGMAEKTHPKTGVKFDSRGFPNFKVYYTVKLRKEYFHETRERHFYMANKILYEDVEASAKIKSKFSKKQIKEISQGETPSGYTWHHHQNAGVLQLVDEEIHAKTYHYGGYSIWGGK